MKLTLPLCVEIVRKTKKNKKIMLNLNVYRNLHHIANNQAKLLYKEEVRLALPPGYATLDSPPYKFTYTLYQGSARSVDVANIVSIIDKFTCDALVEIGLLEDDNFKFISEVVYQFGGIDKLFPRAELFIEKLVQPGCRKPHDGAAEALLLAEYGRKS